MTSPASKVTLITAIVDTFDENRNDDDGNKFLSSSDLAMEAIDRVLEDGDLTRLVRDGWFTEEQARSSAGESG
jgi:hypothetical protein